MAELLIKYRGNKDAIVIGLPRGGVVVAYEVANALGLPLDIVSPRKIGAPHNPELAIGAITETGEAVFDDRLVAYLHVDQDYMNKAIENEKVKAQHRLQIYRKNRPRRNFEGKIVIIVDDGLATGATMKAAIKSIGAEGAAQIIVAVPVSPVDTLEEVRGQVDEAYCLSTPTFFQAVGEFYKDFNQTEDEEVIDLLERAASQI